MSTPFLSRAWFNERDLAQYKLIVCDAKGYISPPPTVDQLVPIPGRMGGHRISRESETGPRRFTVDAVLRASTPTEAEALWAQFLRVVASDEVEVRFAQWPDRVGYARYEGIEVADLPGLYNARRFTMRFLMADPLKYSALPDVYVVAPGAKVPLDLGSAPSDLTIAMVGLGDEDAAVYYLDAQDQVRGAIAFTGPLNLSSWIEVLPEGPTYLHSTESVVTNMAPRLVDTSRFRAANPLDGDATQGPTLLAVNCTALVTLRKAWL